MENYKPFNKKTNFLACKYEGQIKNLYNFKYGYFLKIKNKGHVPKTGVFMSEFISQKFFQNATVLDIGTGETGILSMHAAASGAKKVFSIDINRRALSWAKNISFMNDFDKVIDFNLFDLRKYKNDISFDVILSNPPQMPSSKIKFIHDDGGKDGKLYINHLLNFASKNLQSNGNLFFVIFDFLGVDKSYNKTQTIFQKMELLGFRSKIIARERKIIKIHSYSATQLKWIMSQYPKYNFFKKNNSLPSYQVFLVHGTKL